MEGISRNNVEVPDDETSPETSPEEGDEDKERQTYPEVEVEGPTTFNAAGTFCIHFVFF